MIVEDKAIEPKANSATSIYPAVIIDVVNRTSNNAFVDLQVFCPDVMSGDLKDALYAVNNWLEAPKYPHNGADAYDFEVGGIIIVSFQDGNVSSPQFVRYVNVTPDIIKHNKDIMEYGATSDQNIVGLDEDVTLKTDIIQKGVALLPAIEACGCSDALFHTYGHEGIGPVTPLDKENYITIYRCGKYGTELVYKQKQGILDDEPRLHYVNYDVLEYKNSNTGHTLLNIIKYMLSKENNVTSNHSLIDIVNSTAKEIETDNKYRYDVYDKTNKADVLYWYTKLAGYIYQVSGESSYDNSSKISAIRSDIDKEGLKVSTPDEKSKLNSVIQDSYSVGSFGESRLVQTYDISLYNALSNNRNKDIRYDFIFKLWKNLQINSYFRDIIASRYAIILNNNLFNFRNQYNVSNISNKMLISIACLATAFPTIESFLSNMDLETSNEDIFPTEETYVDCVSYIKQKLENDSGIDKNILSDYLADVYFRVLGWPTDSTQDYFEDQNHPLTYIRSKMQLCVGYILDNYDKLKSVLDQTLDTESSFDGKFIWPTPNLDLITSPFGYRTINGVSQHHDGIDISGNDAAYKDVIASTSGTVVKVDNSFEFDQTDGWSYGNYIIIQKDEKISTRYAHLINICVSEGDTVKQGQKIAEVDNTGGSLGHHLHFEIREQGTAVNPSDYVYSADTIDKIRNKAVQETGEYYNVNLSHDIQDYLFEQCRNYNIPSALMIALIDHESSFNPEAVSSTNDYGLCQINAMNFENLSDILGVTDFLDPKQNILCGCYILGNNIENLGDYHKALMAYNMGTVGANTTYWSRGVYQSSYSIAVMSKYDYYGR